MREFFGKLPNWACFCGAWALGVCTSVGGLIRHLGVYPLGLFGTILVIIFPYLAAILCSGKRRLLWLAGALLAQVLTATVLFIVLVLFGRAFG